MESTTSTTSAGQQPPVSSNSEAEDSKPAAMDVKSEQKPRRESEEKEKQDPSGSDSESVGDAIAKELAAAAAAISAERQGQPTLPQKLRSLLDDGPSEAIWWLPGGKAFAIEPKKFATLVLDKYFQGTKFASFVRRLHKWGFRRETRGFRKELGLEMPRNVTAFCCDLFQRDAPELMVGILEMTKAAKKEADKAEAAKKIAEAAEIKADQDEAAKKKVTGAKKRKVDPEAKPKAKKRKDPPAGGASSSSSSNEGSPADQFLKESAHSSEDSSSDASGKELALGAPRVPVQGEPTNPPQDFTRRSLNTHMASLQQIQENSQRLVQPNPVLAALRQNQLQDPALLYSMLTAPSLAAGHASVGTSTQALLNATIQQQILGSLARGQRLDEASLAAATQTHQHVPGTVPGSAGTAQRNAFQAPFYMPPSNPHAAQPDMLQTLMLLEQLQRQRDDANRR